ncbi:DUF4352 domain-containing protein [bacterium]|nr:MAG: DUF4352 domain-containing protein [bacterium]
MKLIKRRQVTAILVLVALLGTATGWLIYSQWLYRPIVTPQTTVSPQPKYVAKIISSRIDNTGTEVFRPGAGYHYVIVDVEITNSDTADLALAPVIQTHIQSATGERFEMAPAPLDNPFDAGVLALGQSRRGELSYIVPDGVTDTQWVFELGAGYATTRVKLP